MSALLSLSIILIFFLGSFGVEFKMVVIMGVIFCFLELAILFLLKRKLVIPKYFFLYLLFIAALILSITWSVNRANSVAYTLLFVSGGLFWLLSFNLGGIVKIDKILMILGAILGITYFVQARWGLWRIDWMGLISPATFNHNHIGDLWGIILVAVFVGLALKKQIVLNTLLGMAGLYFLLISHSRSAVLSLVMGIIYYFWRKGLPKKSLTFSIPIILAVIIFIYFGLTKNTLFNRPYYFQAFLGLGKYPLGVGLGNFETISQQLQFDNWRWAGFSIIAHDLILETVSALGLFSLTFIYWFYKVTKEMFTVREKNYLLPALWVAMTVNFLFDFTYFIPSMLWIWFWLLGTQNINRDGVILR